ncbi:MAG: outer membrane beta-barrel protein [Nitrospirota bacterium]|nr:MAG: outer membrane beta-barrel protein [Nitrospirota bacterium]
MKKVHIALLVLIFVFIISGSVFAAGREPLGIGHFAVKLDYLKFSDSSLESSDVDTGIYAGVEAFTEMMPDLYFGGEVGYASSSGSGIDISYIPVEINLKYAVQPGEGLVAAVGGGFSYNYATISAGTSDESDWLYGGQFFAEIDLKRDQYFFGAEMKLQLTEGYKDTSTNFNNWRIGARAGLLF